MRRQRRAKERQEKRENRRPIKKSCMLPFCARVTRVNFGDIITGTGHALKNGTYSQSRIVAAVLLLPL